MAKLAVSGLSLIEQAITDAIKSIDSLPASSLRMIGASIRQSVNDNTNGKDKDIDEDLRELVKLLREHGINTVYSGRRIDNEMEMEIEAESYKDEELSFIYHLLMKNGYDGFTLNMEIQKDRNRYSRRRLYLKFHGD